MSYFTPLQRDLNKYLSKRQVEKIYQSYLFAEEAHSEQKRSSGQPYITHPVATAKILASMHLDGATIMAALLHDVIEDTDIEKETLRKRFGREVAELVDGVTKLTQIEFESYAEAQAENFRKMMLAMTKDIRVILIKLSDRLHNMRTLTHLKTRKQRRIARETLEIYAPIANRLGMYAFMIEFENLGFSTLYPERYRVLEESIKRARGNRKEILAVIEKALKLRLKKAKAPYIKLVGREKHLYSIYCKMRRKRHRFSEIMDVYAFRIVVENVDLCYRVLGIIHNLYKPVPERFKDFIAIPKSNGYQSLHTTLFGPYGVPVEIQIRTVDMDQIANSGIASHWLYKSRKRGSHDNHLRAREWIEEVLQIQQSTGSSLEFIENVKVDLFPDELYVFTPQGDIVKLPKGSTVVDFGYAVHTEVGNGCIAAKINRRLAPLSTVLRSGQTIEIITAPGARANPNWLGFVITGRARSGIRHFLKTQKRSQSITLGRYLLEKALQESALVQKELNKEVGNQLIEQLNLKSLEDLLEQIGLGNQMAPLIIRRLENQMHLKHPSSQKSLSAPLSITGTEGMVLNFATCCYPIPGDPIIGVLSAGHGLVVHHSNCRSLAAAGGAPEKYIQLCWEEEVEGQFRINLRVEIYDCRGALARLASAIAGAEGDIIDISVEKKDPDYSIANLMISVHNRVHLANIISAIRKIKDVVKVWRQRSAN
ncbi:MAG: RelA/SpoT family protein [Gammaproteobacteria bacterium]|nr:RelA/SpoT family protein [Gammaproteobacteria bacterium]